MASNKVTIELYVDDKGSVRVKKFAGETEKGFKKIENQAKKTGGTLKNLATAAIGFFAITKIKAAVTDFVRLAGVQEDAVATLEQAMRNAGTYREEDLEGLKAYASQLQEVTRFGDEATLALMANLQGYGMQIDILKEATKATQDLAAAKRMDLFAASELIGKAFVGETQTLSRYGIILDEGIPKGEKFAAVLKLISERYGGQAEALASTKYGGLVQLGNLLGDAKEDIGALVMAITENLLPAFKSWAGHLREIAKFWKEALTPPTSTEKLLEDRIIFTQELELAQGKLVRLQGRLNTMQEAGSDYHVKRLEEEIEKTKQIITMREANLRLINQTLIAGKEKKTPGGAPGAAGPAVIDIGDYYKDQLEEWKQVTADFYAMKAAQEKADLEHHKATLDEWGQVTKDFAEAEQAQWEQETENYLALEKIKAQAHQEELARYEEVMAANEEYMNEISNKGKETFDDLKNAVTGWASSFSSQLNDMLWKADTTFRDILRSFAQMITQMVIQKQVVEPMLGWMFPSAHGNVFDKGRVVPYAQGGIVTRPTLFPMAKGLGLMGEKGPEGVLPLTRIRGGDLGVKTEGVIPIININMINQSGQPLQATQSRLQSGQESGKFILDVVIKELQRGKTLRQVIRSTI